MKSWIDYTAYRISKLYHKYDNALGVYAALIISLTEGILLMDMFLLVAHFVFKPDELQTSKIAGPIIIIISIFPLSLFNYMRYVRSKGIYEKFNYIWKDESYIIRVSKALLIIVCLLTPWALLFIMNSLYHN